MRLPVEGAKDELGRSEFRSDSKAPFGLVHISGYAPSIFVSVLSSCMYLIPFVVSVSTPLPQRSYQSLFQVVKNNRESSNRACFGVTRVINEKDECFRQCHGGPDQTTNISCTWNEQR